MASSSAVSFVICLAVLPSCQGQGLRMSGPVKKPEVFHAEIKGVLAEVLGQGHGVAETRLGEMRATLLPMFRALPHNKRGRLSGPVMRYAVRRYFSQKNAWLLTGFEPHAELVNISQSSDNILQGKVPEYIRSVLEEKFDYDGFAFEDVVAMVAAMERLAFDEVVNYVETSYWLENASVMDALSHADMMDVLSTYLITSMLKGTTNKTEHLLKKKHISRLYPHWETTALFLIDIAGSDTFERRSVVNPFVTERKFSFHDLIRMAERVSEEFGPWSDHECHTMKDALVARDVHGSGRVKLADFYQRRGDGHWQFEEPPEYLRQLGALDESSPSLGPQVLIPNYITALGNCIVTAPYYSICCLNECDQIYQHLEAQIPASAGTPSEIIQVVESLPSPPNITGQLRTRLNEVAEIHDGNVPLHGRLMAQWLHFTFPQECPYPHEAGTISPKTPHQWISENGEDKAYVSLKEMRQIFKEDRLKGALPPMSVAEAMNASWTLKESLLVASTPSDDSDALLLTVAQFCVMVSGAAVLLKVFNRVSQKKTKLNFLDVDI